MASKHLFLEFMSRQDKLTKSWNIELGVVCFLCIGACFAFRHSIGILAWFPVYAFVTFIIGIVSVCKVSDIYRLNKLAALIVSRHKNEKLKSIFDKGKKCLLMIMILDILYPITWFISVIVKLTFTRNVHSLKMLISVSEKR